MIFTASDLEFLEAAVIPVRLSVLAAHGNPAIASLWFRPSKDALWCAVQTDSFLAKCLRRDARCAFEVAGDRPPYRGVRGQATAAVVADSGSETLEFLLDRYLGDRDQKLRGWLLSRSETEVALRVSPTRISRWDYSRRMEPRSS